MTTTRHPAIRTLTIAGQQVTVIPMTTTDLTHHTEDIDVLDLPNDYHHLAPLRGWNIYDATGQHIGRLFSRGGIMTAEWYDDIDEFDWILAEWNCRRIERGIHQIFLLRDERLRAAKLAAQAKVQEREAAYLVELAHQGLTLDEDGRQVPLHLAA
ncbi:hypothetical protein SAM23877_p041 (plasmid) [Streptomyces ambofaciens ATCC 23877]|uniref:Uncharacterized protein n=1 Tax=Streptomyces ambofaciens (strain ATCC 23877 / 3486 / DSM 40053 / JCM 4204 / NBRC 12836 / NRRL B-2516) TaxID=278992 RepID=A0A0K2B5R2_STRA7|nr:hypothetical protein [Streptomyces ambofaciens]AKZ60750.1 hypothetical protein SAM23877_p041 [Streptomyces ambofaciens ATCC 23877]